MTREAVLKNAAAGGKDTEFDSDLRPSRLSEVIGQRDVLQRIQIVIDSAIKRNEALGHVLLDGPPGLGKTTLGLCLPHELKSEIQMTSGAVVKAPKDLIPYLTNAKERSILFIDEIHRLPPAAEEYLYTAMEDFRIDIILGDGVNARTHNVWLKRFTLVGATTRAGMLSGPLRDRFQIREHLRFYDVGELTEIVLRSAQKLRVAIDSDSASLIASRSRGTPRVANNRLRWIRDYATSRHEGRVDSNVAEQALKMAGIDTLGLDDQDRAYLSTLIRVFGGGPAGIEAISHTMNASLDTLSDEVEPFLLRTELVVRTPRGRLATALAYRHMEIDPPLDAQGELFDP